MRQNHFDGVTKISPSRAELSPRRGIKDDKDVRWASPTCPVLSGHEAC